MTERTHFIPFKCLCFDLRAPSPLQNPFQRHCVISLIAHWWENEPICNRKHTFKWNNRKKNIIKEKEAQTLQIETTRMWRRRRGRVDLRCSRLRLRLKHWKYTKHIVKWNNQNKKKLKKKKKRKSRLAQFQTETVLKHWESRYYWENAEAAVKTRRS